MKKQRLSGLLLVNGILLLLVLIWSIPSIGLFISSFRNAVDIATSGWWKVFPHREWVMVAESDPKVLGLDPDGVMTVEGVSGTFDELREGIESPDGKTRVTWVGNKRLGKIQVQKQVWTVTWNFTLDNYRYVLSTSSFTVTRADGSTDILVRLNAPHDPSVSSSWQRPPEFLPYVSSLSVPMVTGGRHLRKSGQGL